MMAPPPGAHPGMPLGPFGGGAGGSGPPARRYTVPPPPKEVGPITIEEFYTHYFEPVTNAPFCSDDAILAARKWIITNVTDRASSDELVMVLQEYALRDTTSSERRLRVIYLCNDLLHHSVRLQAMHILSSLNELLIPLCHAACKGAPVALQTKVEAAILLWEADQLITERLRSNIQMTYLRRDQPKPFAWKESSTNRLSNAAGARAPQALTRQDVHKQASRLAAAAAAGGGLGLGEKIEGGSGPAYFEQPAGLMVTAVKVDDTLYAALDPGELRRPPAEDPSQALRDAFAAFINPVAERNAEGWEKGGLDAHYKRKEDALHDQNPFENDDATGNAGDAARSRSASPEGRGIGLGFSGAGGLGSNNGGRRSRSRSRSPSATQASRNKLEWSKRRSRSRSPGAARAERSPSPESARPSFGGGGGKQTLDTHLGQSNIGFKMMMKQGWQKGKGLGASESGLQEPIRPAGVREKSSMYKGIGNAEPDVYEKYRNQKSRTMYDGMTKRGGSKR